VFGAWRGQKYDDNSKYLFEYVSKNNNDEIEAIWLSYNPTVVEEVRQRGFRAYRSGSLRGVWIQLKAGAAIYTNSLMDFGFFPLVGGAEILTTWHGMSFKKIYNSKYSGWSRKTKVFLDHIFSWTYRTFSTVTSEQGKKWLMESFTLDPNEIYITGQPRNDILKEVNKQNVLEDSSIPIEKRLILYFPTYRNSSMGENAIQDIIEKLYDSKELDDALKLTNSIFVVKPHPVTPPLKLKSRDNFMVFDYKTVKNNQELLGVGDILITDYSGCFIDFALLNRPIIFYVPDEEKFLKESEDIDRNFFEISCLNKAINPIELADKIMNPSIAACQKTNDIWEDESIKGTNYSENVYHLILKKVGLCYS
jgi:CDP-glycerol glycerophosphotransferase (TagB/SpsB family)